MYDIPEKAFDMAKDIHFAWDKCSQGTKRLHARNTQQILGLKLDKPSDFIICWTPNGKTVGGTATAIKLAKRVSESDRGESRAEESRCG